jgi:hypothetical protein
MTRKADAEAPRCEACEEPATHHIVVRDQYSTYTSAKLCEDHGQAAFEKDQAKFEQRTPPEARDERKAMAERLCNPDRASWSGRQLNKDSQGLGRELGLERRPPPPEPSGPRLGC